jgi:hypothetical protein
LDLPLQVRGDIFTFTHQLEQGVEIGYASGNLPVVLERFLEPFPVLHDLLASFGGIPEIGGTDFFFST